MREELINKIICALQEYDIPIHDLQQKLTIILNDYEVQDRCTDVAVLNEDRNEMLVRKFIVAKTVSGRTKRTVEYYGITIRNVLSRIGKVVDDIEADDIRYYLAIREKRDGVSTTTAQNEFRAISSFYSYLMAEEIITKNPCLKIDRAKPKKRQKKAFMDIEIEQIRNACETSRDKAMIEVLLSTGCRVSELVNIGIDEIENDQVIVHGKGEKDRTVYLNAKAQLALSVYLAERNDNNPYVFCGGLSASEVKSEYRGNNIKQWYTNPNLVTDTHTDICTIEQRVRKIGKRAGVENVHPHRFRRTCATFALRRGMPIEQVSKMLGHESIETTQIYLDLTQEDLRQAHKKYVV